MVYLHGLLKVTILFFMSWAKITVKGNSNEVSVPKLVQKSCIDVALSLLNYEQKTY